MPKLHPAPHPPPPEPNARHLPRALTRAAALCLAVATCGTAGAEATPCDDPMFLADDAGLGLHEQMCATAAEARTLLENCAVSMARPVTVIIRPDLNDEHPHCVGVFDCTDDRIELLPPDRMKAGLYDASPFLGIAAEAYFDSILVHELAHALSDQTTCLGDPCRVDMEYIAYALQMQSLSEEDRDAVLSGWPVTAPVPRERLNELVLSFVPHRFAILAWTHFSQPGNGCALVGRLLTGDATFEIPQMDLE